MFLELVELHRADAYAVPFSLAEHFADTVAGSVDAALSDTILLNEQVLDSLGASLSKTNVQSFGTILGSIAVR